jgi:ATP-independent RNA helicase DbpA
MSNTDFSSLDLHKDLLTNLDSIGYKNMTAIQSQSLPHILTGKDVIGQGKTGSGKTAAFGLGLLNRLNAKFFRVQGLVLCPTRELADQVAQEIRRLARTIHNIKVLTLCGGMPFGPQLGSLEHGAHIIVGTPGRIEEHVRRGSLVLKNLQMLVLDEADRMLDMGFQEELDAIIAQTPERRQTLMFSATFPQQIKAVAERIMKNALLVQVETTHAGHVIEQHFYQVQEDAEQQQRKLALRLLLQHYQPASTVVFCNTKRDAQTVADELVEQGFSALAIHGDLEQRDRDQALVRFANGSVAILVATDVAARGLDIESLDAVINFHIARESEVHVHRIGRTGRAGCQGLACSLYSDKEEFKVQSLARFLGQDLKGEPLPAEDVLNRAAVTPKMVTLQIDGGKRQKLRPGDILGALTASEGILGTQVGKINVFADWAFVAVAPEVAKVALKQLNDGKLKGRRFRARLLKESSR